MDNKSMSDRNGKVVEEKVPLRRADTLKKNRWRKSGTEINPFWMTWADLDWSIFRPAYFDRPISG